MTRSALAKVSLILAVPLVSLFVAGCSKSPMGTALQPLTGPQPRFSMGKTITFSIAVAGFDHSLPPATCLTIGATFTQLSGHTYPEIDWASYDDGSTIPSYTGTVDPPAHAHGPTETYYFGVNPGTNNINFEVKAKLYSVSVKTAARTLMASATTGVQESTAPCIG